MGLVGGLAALGVGKLIGSIADKIDKAQDSAIGMDRIYRQIGGIASFGAIKNTMYGVGNRLGMDVGDANNMASSYIRASNLRAGDNLATGMLVSGGMARSYGMDPSAAAGIMGGFRGANISQNDAGTRRIGLIIGETIAKSNAFGKAEEMMQAVSQYALAQARQALVAPNLGGYGGAMASLMSANIPGLDVAGSASLLNRVNSSLSGGGAMGDASQFLTARVGVSNGLNPFQMRILREGGMFATKDQMFGSGSQYGASHKGGPGGDQSFFSMTRDQLRRNYRAGSDDYYLAMANHMGISVNQAMALDKMDTGTIGSTSSRMGRLGLDLSKVNPTSIATLGQIDSGRGLSGLASGYLNMKGDKALNGKEREDLLSAYKGTDPEKLKDVLMQVASKRGAVETEGSQIRDGIAQLNNNFTKYADAALPALNIMRMAAVNASGGSEASMRESYMKNEKADRRKRIDDKYRAQWEQVAHADAETWASGNHRIDTPAALAKKKLNDQIRAEKAASDAEVDKIYGGGGSAVENAMGAGEYGDSPAAAAAAAGAGGNAAGGGAASGNLAGFNVGNIRNASGNGFRRYGSAREGVGAMAGQLLRYQSGKFDGRKRTTLRQLISTYAPANENNTSEYISQVSQWTGINPDAPIDLRNPDIMNKVMKAMIRKENGNKGLDAANGHISEGISDAMGNQRNFTPAFQSEVRIAVDVNGPWGTKTASHTAKNNFQQPNSWNRRP